MSEEKKMTNGKVENSETQIPAKENADDVEGYAVCTTYAQRCTQDCLFLHNAVASAIE